MVGVSQIEIKESTEQIKHLMHLQTNAMAKERLQVLYLLKSLQAESITHAAQLVGRDRTTVQRWLLKYQAQGIERLLAPRTGQGRKRKINETVSDLLDIRLQERHEFHTYGEVQQWLETEHGLAVKYGTVHLHVRYRLGAKLKVPRPVSVEQDAAAMSLFQKPWLPA
ncbi:MAG: helix-turn-helix domain-containing protein [Plectolyngbya sp. WJT66-NPBG17]|jgi:transposase|nr:helix-turn-helix domain-containing protein [Plectolyngbya sp. WJT66-NPBG17]